MATTAPNQITFHDGEVVDITVTFTNSDTGNPQDPDQVYLDWEPTGGTKTSWQYGIVPTSQLNKLSTGVYQALLPVSVTNGMKQQRWEWRLYGTGNNAGTFSGYVVVLAKNL